MQLLRKFILKINLKLEKVILLLMIRVGVNSLKEYATTRLITQREINQGEGLKVRGMIDISYDKSVIIGSNVTIGANCKWNSEGGIVIGDHVQIGNNVQINTSQPTEKAKFLDEDTLLFNPKQVVIKSQTVIPDHSIIQYGTVVGDDIPLTNDNKKKQTKLGRVTLKESSYRPVFVVNTGRVGSASLTYTLAQHPDIYVVQESKRQINYLSTAYAYGLVGYPQMKANLHALYNIASIYPSDTLIIESDQKFGNLITLINEIFPDAIFIWLIRNGLDFVSSSWARGWMSDEDTGNNREEIVLNTQLPSWGVRINGYKCGEFSKSEWDKMSLFSKNCWYWFYWNNLIESQLNKISQNRWRRVKLENLSQELIDILEFVEVPIQNLELLHANKVKPAHTLIPSLDWTGEQKLAFKKWAGKGMERWYPELVLNF